jgi:hypothetical protein
MVGVASDAHLAAGRFALPGRHFHQLPLAVTGNAGDADELAGTHRKRDITHGNGACIVQCAELVEFEVCHADFT